MAAGAAIGLDLSDKAQESLDFEEATALTDASQALQTVDFAIMSVLAYDDGSEAGRTAPIVFRDALLMADRSFAEATTFATTDSVAVSGLKRRFDDLRPAVRDVFLLDNALPGLTLGVHLDSRQLAELGTAASSTAKVVEPVHRLAEDAQSLGREIQTRRADAAEQTPNRGDALTLAVAVAGLAGLWLSRLRPERIPAEALGDPVAPANAPRSAVG